MLWSAERAVVTGSSSGIGQALVQALQERGAAVAHCSRSGGGGGAVCDVSDQAQVVEFAQQVFRDIGTPTLLVNNAGVARWGLVHEQTLADWNANISVNLTGMFLVTRAFLPAMLEAKRGTIVNVSSLSGRNGVAGGSAYSASKHGVLGFSRSLMMEVRKQGLRVMTICPGSVDTPIFDKDTPPFAIHRDTMMAPADIAQAILDAVAQPDRTMVTELDIRPTNP